MSQSEKHVCPHCESNDVVYKTKAAVWECQVCEERFNPIEDFSRYIDSKTNDPKAIFFSYGHDSNKELVDKLKHDLEKRGHTVWIDYKEIGTWNDWRGKITQGIHDSQMAIAFLSKHAIREPGVCRNEVAMALNAFGTVYPVLLEPYQQVTPPVTISHLQWQDLSQWRDIRDGKIDGLDWARWYEEHLIQIITLVEGEATEFQGDINGLREVLKPISFTSDIARHIPDFTGRQWVFDAYEDWLDNQPQSRLFWIKAGPGVGKSAIAAMLTHTHQSAIVSAWFCQSNSIERRDTHSALCAIAFQLATRWDDYRRKLRFQLGFNASTKPEDWSRLREELVKKNENDLFNFLFSEPLTGLIWRENRLVIVIDALDEASDANGNNPLVDLLVTRLATLPSWLNFVVTSRPNPEVVAKLQAFSPFELDTEDKRNREDLENYLQSGLAKRADFIALSKDAQARIQQVLLDNSEGMILYLQQILNGLQEGSIKIDQVEQIPKGLGSLYRIAFDHLYGGDKLKIVYDTEIAPLLRLLLAAPEEMPPALAQQVLGWDKATYLRRRNGLASYVIDSAKGCRLFHKTLYEWLSSESSSPYYLDAQPAQKILAEHLWHRFDTDEDQYKLEWAYQTQYWLPELLPQVSQWEDVDALIKLGSYLDSFAQFPKAEVLVRHALSICEKSLGEKHVDSGVCLYKLAHLLEAQADYKSARKLYERALEISEINFGAHHPETATILDTLAYLFEAQGNYDGAWMLYERALEIRKKGLGAEHPDTATSLDNLATLLLAQYKYDAAQPLYESVLAIREKTLGADHPDTATSLSNLALLRNAQGDFGAARLMLERAVAINEKHLGAEHLSTADCLNNLASLLLSRADYEAARPMYERALVIYENLLGESHPNTANILDNLADLLMYQGEYEGARSLYERVLSIREKSLGEAHPSTAKSLDNLADLLIKSQGEYDKVRSLYERAISIREGTLGATHPATVASLDNLKDFLEAGGDIEALRDQAEGAVNQEADRSLYEGALEISEKTLGPNHPATSVSLDNLAKYLSLQGEYEAARPLYERALEIREKTLGAEHPETATNLDNLADLLKAQGDYEAARSLYERALAIREKNMGASHPATATSLFNLALLLDYQSEHKAARTLYERALAIREEALGAEHLDTAEILHSLAYFLEAQGDYKAAKPLYERAFAIIEKI